MNRAGLYKALCVYSSEPIVKSDIVYGEASSGCQMDTSGRDTRLSSITIFHFVCIGAG